MHTWRTEQQRSDELITHRPALLRAQMIKALARDFLAQQVAGQC